ncbi:hypothetical protein HDV01_000235 [Terramyces sp. JEL0728]|nr:hypothetical protein HDV01_000235 [Terramyces sp. JEL0728]
MNEELEMQHQEIPIPNELQEQAESIETEYEEQYDDPEPYTLFATEETPLLLDFTEPPPEYDDSDPLPTYQQVQQENGYYEDDRMDCSSFIFLIIMCAIVVVTILPVMIPN